MGVPEVPFKGPGKDASHTPEQDLWEQCQVLKLDCIHQAHSFGGIAPLFISSSKQRKSSLCQPPSGVDRAERTEGRLRPPLSSRAEPTSSPAQEAPGVSARPAGPAPERVLSAAQVALVAGCSQKPALNAQERVVGLVCFRALTFQRSQHHSSELKTAESHSQGDGSVITKSSGIVGRAVRCS